MSTAWMRGAACQDRPELPWTREMAQVVQRDVESMREVCAACPVLSACSNYAEGADVCGGFWAGEWRVIQWRWWMPFVRDEDVA